MPPTDTAQQVQCRRKAVERRSARVGPRTTIVAQMFAFVKALRQKKRCGEGKGGNRPA